MRYNYKDCIGKKFNHLTITGESTFRKKTVRSVKCLCDCGNETWVDFSNITSGHIKSCGCIYRKSEGDSETRFYNIFNKMCDRCENESSSAYKWYGGRGIKCLWKNYSDFKKDMYDSYCAHVNEYGEVETTIDRIDPDKDYCKDNCRWATNMEQQNNRRNTRYIQMDDGSLITIRELSEKIGIPFKTLDNRYYKIDKEHKRIVNYSDLIKDKDIV